MQRSTTLIFTVLSALSLAGCSGAADGDAAASSMKPADETPAATGPTFHKDVEPILQKSCQNCHAPGKIAPFSLMTYGDAKAVASLVALRTGDRAMPPWSATDTDDCKPRFGWKDDKRLSAEEIATIQAW